MAVLGASGFIGRWLARSLSRQGARLYLVVRDRRKTLSVCAEYGVVGQILEMDLNDEAAVRKIYQLIQPSITFNAAAYGVHPSQRDEFEAYRTNADLVEFAARAAASVRDAGWQGQDLVHIGSAQEYGQVGGFLRECDGAAPTTLYARSKLQGAFRLAARAKELGLKVVTARLFTVYGPGEHSDRLLPSLIMCSQGDSALELTSGQQKRDFTYVEDVAEGLLRLGLCRAPGPELVNLATGRLTAVRDFVEQARNVLGIPADRLRFGAIPTRSDELKHDGVAVDQLHRLIAWTPSTSIEEGIRRTVEFVRLNLERQEWQEQGARA